MPSATILAKLLQEGFVMHPLSRRALLAQTSALLTCLTLPAMAAKPALAATATAKAEGSDPGVRKALFALFTKSDEADLKLNPVSALFRGDTRYADQFGDYLSPAFLAANQANRESDAKDLAAIDRQQLNAKDQVAYDVFAYQTAIGLKALAFGALQQMLPLDHFTGVHVFFADLSSGQSAAQFRTVRDYENNLKRITGFVRYLEQSMVKMREGMRAGVVQTKITMRNVVGQLDGLLKAGLAASPFLLPVQKFPADIPANEQERLRAATQALVAQDVLPTYQRLRDFIAQDYLPACRDQVGLLGLKGGVDYYAFLVESNTTTQMTPEAIHTLGLEEVARIRQEMERVKEQVGFRGDLKAFFAFLRTDQQFYFTTREALINGYKAIGEKLKPALPRLFKNQPKTPFEIRPVPDFLEQNQAAAYYNQGSPDGSRPGVFYANTYDLKARPSYGMETLFLHEALPGHHFQISLAQEDTSLPAFMRFGGNTAYVEGWALYAESLGRELGLFSDPYQYMGRLNDEMLRAMRLVIDTGLHAKGWTREQGIAYMLENSAQSERDCIAEVERYIVIAGQALAYKIGDLTLQRLRSTAQETLKARFDIRDFHDEVLNTGALPMAVLEAKIKRWAATPV
jgi:uncharacterized protein (DUF885 family)